MSKAVKNLMIRDYQDRLAGVNDALPGLGRLFRV